MHREGDTARRCSLVHFSPASAKQFDNAFDTAAGKMNDDTVSSPVIKTTAIESKTREIKKNTLIHSLSIGIYIIKVVRDEGVEWYF